MQSARRFARSERPFQRRARPPLSERAQYYHRVLGIPFGSRRSTVRRAYHALARIYHPDVNPVGSERMRLLNEAYRHLLRCL